ncbi:glycosyltransferase [Kutzneria sp. NPDC052558]|uniref:glycosyltransferase n=1 Tax=Kutzneria sp. NPDC052558 TaxID=3364121 RepID=UPI0037CB904E
MGKGAILGSAALALVSAARSARTVATWRTVRPLPEAPLDKGKVSVVIPVRDEESTIDGCLASLRTQRHSDLEIVVVDDASTDRTVEIVRQHVAEDPRVRLVRTDGPPPGWAGKVHAMYRGVAETSGEWLLFVDSDTESAPDLVGKLVAAAARDDADLITTPGRATVPNSGWWLLLAPTNVLLFDTASPDGSRGKAVGIGHCILVSRAAYDRTGGWRALSGEHADDVAFATAVRDAGGRTRLVDGMDSITSSGLDSFGAVWRSQRKSMVAGGAMVGGPAAGAAALGLGGLLHIAYGVAPVLMSLRGNGFVRLAGLAAWAAQAAAHRTYMVASHQSGATAVLAPVANATFGAQMLDAAWRSVRGGNLWKGRDIR